jgi:cytochrome c oxidase subunit 2
MLLFQDAASPLIEQLIFFHDHVMLVLVLIVSLVLYVIGVLGVNKLLNRYLYEGQEIELVWTVLPALMLVFIGFPSLRLLYLLDEVNLPLVTLKVVGHQWYWSYEYSDFEKVEFDSFIIGSGDLSLGDYRCLEVDNRIVIPFGVQVRALITAADVLHSWAVPALGLKVDAVPGRLNQLSFMVTRPGVLYGQCSEICGANHSFIPIVMEVVCLKDFVKWVLSVLLGDWMISAGLLNHVIAMLLMGI